MIPVSLLAALFIFTACQDATKSPPVARQAVLPDSADQMLFGIWFLLNDAGVRRAEVRADTAFMYDENTRTEMKQLKTDFYSPTGEKSGRLTGLTGTYSSRLGTMEARGNVVVVTTDGRRLETPHLRYDPSRNEVTSDSAFTLTRGTEQMQGVGFISDPDMKNIRVLTGMKAFGKSVVIPKK